MIFIVEFFACAAKYLAVQKEKKVTSMPNLKKVYEAKDIRKAIDEGYANSDGIILLIEQGSGSGGNLHLIIGASFNRSNMKFMKSLIEHPGAKRSSDIEKSRILGDLAVRGIGVFSVTEDVIRQVISAETFEDYATQNHLMKGSSRSLQVAAV
ncbi:MAG: hypothetical protein ACD_56C00012G0009 [uncultured bacterium]|nr:MAG: hypothetical protein ACD_56C00012G0009 [uncultured bacterium]